MVCDAISCIPSCVVNMTENLYWWFHHSAKRVAELHSFQEWLQTDGHKILKKVDTGWLSLEACVNRIIEQYPPLVSYFDSIELSKMPGERATKVRMLREQLKKPLTKGYLLFLSNASVTKFNLLFQSSSPNIQCLLKEMKQLLLHLLNKFIIPQAIQSASCLNYVDIDRKNQKQDDDLLLETAVRVHLRKFEDQLLGTADLANFYLNVCAFLSKLVTSALKRLPFHDPVIRDVACLDPAERLTSTIGMIRRLIESFSKFIPNGKADQIEEEFSLYQTTKDLPPNILVNTRVDVFGGEIDRIGSKVQLVVW